MRFSTGAVRDYAGCGGSDLPLTIPEARAFAAWYLVSGHTSVSMWENGDVWASDFRDNGGDLEPSGGSDLPEIYFFSGHGRCQDPSDFIITCSGTGGANTVDIGSESGWGDPPGTLQFLFVDASCPMDLVSLERNWFRVFRGLHMAVGHSGTREFDTLDSKERGSQFAARTAGIPVPEAIRRIFPSLFPHQSVGDAWMDTGTIDIPLGCFAVAIAAGTTREEAIDRAHNERVADGRSDPIANWFCVRVRPGVFV